MLTLNIDTRGLDALLKNVQRNRNTEVEVGFFPEDRYGPDNNNQYVANVANMQQLGTERYTLGFPARPFFDDTVEDRTVQFHLAKMMEKTAIALLTNVNTFRSSFFRVGVVLQESVMVAIDDYPGSNSPRWAAVKGFNDPLYHTGKMFESVKVKFRE